ncbi:hypothetical protein TNCV_5036121 [Trichonephila clavipes]|nr:hypothetical protein TNCV_5036121 [Trichonephila clavipes]
MSPTGERSDEGRNIRTKQNPLGPQERQTRIDRAVITLKNNDSQLGYDARLNVSLHSLIVILPFLYSYFKNKQIILANPSLRIHPSTNITFGSSASNQIKLKLKNPRKYDESRLVDHARFNDGTGNANHNDEISNGEFILIYSFIVLKIFVYEMVCLEEIAAIANILKTAPASTVQLLHKIVNDEPYSKSSRKELKKFAGFPQNYDIEARKDKILKDFTKTELITVCTILGLNCAGSAKELSEHIFKNLSDLASLKNNFTEQLTDDEDEDSAPFSLESTNDANKQPLTPPIYDLLSPQDVFVPLPQTQRNQSQRGNEKNAFLLKDLFSTMRSFTGNDNYSVKAFFRDIEENFIFKTHTYLICKKLFVLNICFKVLQRLLSKLSITY